MEIVISVILSVVVGGFIVRVFPNVVSAGLVRHIEHKYNKRIEQLKGYFAGHNSSLKSAVDYIVAAQVPQKQKVFEAIESLWKAIVDTETVSRTAMFYQSIMVPSEFESLFRGERNDAALRIFGEHEDWSNGIHEELGKIDNGLKQTEVLYVSNKMWGLYQVIGRVHGRMAVLIEFSLRDKQYHDWRADDVMHKFLAESVPSVKIEDAKERPLGGLHDLIVELKAQFILEARAIIGGSEMFKDSLSEIFDALKSNVDKPHDRDRPR